MPRPAIGDAVWVQGVTPQPNGKIVYIDWHDKEVIVEFYDSKDQETYTWDQFNLFNERLNQWQIKN